jgi:sulfoxide reductase heme-binding subunit YedZ
VRSEKERETSRVSSDPSPLTLSPARRAARHLPRMAFFLLCVLPACVMVFDALTGHLASEPIKDLTHRTGTWGLTCLTATLAVTPLRRLTGWNRLQSYRRMLGLFAFFYLLLHFTVYLVLDQFFDWRTIVQDVAKRPYITVGFTGLVLMVPLALTSTRGWVKRLGRRWVTLHALVYVTALAGIVHFTWSQKADLTRPRLYGAAIVVLLGARFAPRPPRAARSRRRGGVVLPRPVVRRSQV